MAFALRIASLAEVARFATDREEFSLACRDFLDGYYAAPSLEKIAEEPVDLAGRLRDDRYANAYLAAMAEYLAHRDHFDVPIWSLDPARVAGRPVFAFKTYEGRMFLLVESPAEFRARNIFISADGLTRV